MSDAGYTLVEMLVALIIVGLAISGLSAGMGLLGRLQSTDAQAVFHFNAMHSAQLGIESLFTGRGPVRSVDEPGLVGDATAFRMPCGPEAACQAQLTRDPQGRGRLVLSTGQGQPQTVDLHEPGPLSFSYVDEAGPEPVWPPIAGGRHALRAVAVMRGPSALAGQPVVLEARVWSEHPADCAFDVALRDCR